jgi:hypothetical protein
MALSSDLYRLVYLSRNGLRGDSAVIRKEIDHMLTAARRNNPILGVTGALMFNAGCFAQVLEGSHDSIQSTFERIQCDPRHSNVTVLAFKPAAARGFGDWSMAYVGENRRALDEFEHIQLESGFDAAKLTGERVFELLREHLLAAEATAA